MAFVDFLARFVSEDLREEANEAMTELFASMQFEMARNFVEKKNKSEVVSPVSSPPVEKEKKKKNKKEEAPAPAKKKNAEKCSALTAKGNPCKNKAIDGELCRVHSKSKNAESKSVDSTKKKSKKAEKTKKMKEVPEHNHVLTEETHEDCNVCEEHGNMASVCQDEDGFEDVDIAEKLKQCLNSIENEDGIDFSGCFSDEEEEEGEEGEEGDCI